jgi:hypothetical protein
VSDTDGGYEVHWENRWDPDNGEPYGILCWCEITTDHDGDGNPMP